MRQFLSLTFWIFLAMAGPARAGDCWRLWRGLVAEPEAPAIGITDRLDESWPALASPQASFEADAFDGAKSIFAERLSRQENLSEIDRARLASMPRSVTALALMEAASQHAGTRNPAFRELLGSVSPREQAKWQRMLGGLDGKGPARWSDIETFVQRLYLVANPPSKNYRGLPELISKRLPTPVAQVIRRRVSIELWRSDLTSAMAELGLARDPSTRDYVERWFAEHPNLTEWAYTTAVDTFSWSLLGVPVHLPRMQATQMLGIPPSLIAEVRARGFDAAYPMLKDRFGRLARFDSSWSVGRTTLYRAALVTLAYAMSSYLQSHGYVIDPRFWQFYHRFRRISARELEKLQEETFDADKVRREQFLSFKRSYVEFEGPFDEEPPNPWDSDFEARLSHFPASYASEARLTWGSLVRTSPDDLKARFGTGAKAD